ncbi:flagellar motor switch phosphatase FliY [Mangrovibacillus cuniculi]|uniref:Flagellar motor switch phosphatase FliY n=1 Tax=Mangrovibacillus cuniculi TaxID=2593652 RepID=A0A7S8HEY7_9BACI|nr:flagellar motor switch phosphatase FliY [Mangrovibacillus cuniculi]QPC46354.1 flagellar motor switch phosphatase FliY [Mangrovibacillus cuniculi]
MMSDEMLSQEEIDALLKGTSDDSSGNGASSDTQSSGLNVDDYLLPEEQDALGEIGNISFGSSATALSTLLNQKVEITTPTVSVVDRSNLRGEFPDPYVAINVGYTEGFSGNNLLVIKQSDAAIIADLMLGGDGRNPAELLGEIQLSAVQEAMNQMMGSAATSMSTIFKKKVDISPPSIDLLDLDDGKGQSNLQQDDLLVRASFSIKVGDLIDSKIMQLSPLTFAKQLVSELFQPVDTKEEKSVTIEEKDSSRSDHLQQSPTSVRSASVNEVPYSHGNTAVVAEATGPHHFGGTQSSYGQSQVTNIQPASFTSFEAPSLQEHEARNLNMLLDIPLQVTVELGRTKRSVKEILELSSGSIIELDKLAGEPVDILVNSRLVAKGEVVVIEENFGVRITDIVSQSERIKKLK